VEVRPHVLICKSKATYILFFNLETNPHLIKLVERKQGRSSSINLLGATNKRERQARPLGGSSGVARRQLLVSSASPSSWSSADDIQLRKSEREDAAAGLRSTPSDSQFRFHLNQFASAYPTIPASTQQKLDCLGQKPGGCETAPAPARQHLHRCGLIIQPNQL
jgi:hypothetical protein